MSSKVSVMYKVNKSAMFAILALVAVFPLAGCVGDNFLAEDDTYSPYGGSKQHPIKVAGGKAYVENCGVWPKDLGDTADNEMPANHGCAVQSNIAAMVAYPDDLTGRRNQLPPPLGVIQYVAVKKITEPSSSSSTPTP